MWQQQNIQFEIQNRSYNCEVLWLTKQYIDRPKSEMLVIKQTFYCLILLAVVGTEMCAAVRITQKTISKGFLVQSIMQLLNKLEKSNDLNVNIQFTAILSEFLIKRKCF